eukprot:512468_1
MAEGEDVDLNLWSFIKSTKATRLAPLKSMQKFILSLNRTELTHLITSYLHSKLSQSNSFDGDGLTLDRTANALLRNESSDNTLGTIDKQIVAKLNAQYGGNMEPNNDECNPKHLLSIPQQVLAYSFQFLSFRELCQAQTVCVHFMYLNKQYPALTHYYLKIDTKFCQNAMRYRVCLSNLSSFKHVDIKTAYYGMGTYCSADKKRRSQLFQFLLRTIIRQSKSSLDVLSIHVPSLTGEVLNSTFECPPFSVLLYIMHEFDQLPISKLFWRQDYVKPSRDCSMSQVLVAIQSKFVHFFPRLTSLSLPIIRRFMEYGNDWDSLRAETLPFDPLRQYVIAPTIIDFGNRLHSLDISVNYWQNLLSKNGNLIQLISKHMANLKRLTISPCFKCDGETSDIINLDDINHISQHTQLQALRISFRGWANINADISKILQFLFSTFIGITEFKYENPYSRNAIDWEELWTKLTESKRMYNFMNKEHDALLPLESLQFNRIHYQEGLRIMKSILSLQYCDLKHIGMCFSTGCAWKNFVFLSKKYFVPFLRLYQRKNAQLSSINLRIGDSGLAPTSFEPILDILCNLPPSVASIHFKLHYTYRNSYPDRRKTMQLEEQMKFVKKLCEMSLETKERSKLETISFDGLKIASSAQNYLLFWYGFNNNISIMKNKYYLQLT